MPAGPTALANFGVGSWIERRARIAPDDVALIGGERSFTYAELAGRVRLRLARMARAVVGVLPDGIALGVPGGELGQALADAIASKIVRVVTCSIEVAMLLAPRPNVRLLFAGGTVGAGSYEVSGSATRAGLGGLNLGAVVIHAEGLTSRGAFASDPHSAAATRCLVERARHVVAVAEAEACGVPSGAAICGADQLDWVVTDRAAEPASLAELQRLGILVSAV